MRVDAFASSKQMERAVTYIDVNVSECFSYSEQSFALVDAMGRWRWRVPVIRACSRCGRKNRIPPARLADTGHCGACKAELPPMSEPLEADDESFDAIIADAGVPVLVDFWAAWCGPCRMAAPQVARVASEMAGKAVVVKVNTEEHPNLAARFRVQAIPNFVVFVHGQPVMQKAGLADHEQMKNWLVSAASESAA